MAIEKKEPTRQELEHFGIQVLYEGINKLQQALITDTTIDFEFLEEAKKLLTKASSIKIIYNCSFCQVQIEKNKDNYDIFYLQQRTSYRAKEEKVTNLVGDKGKLVLCIKCGENLVKFIEKDLKVVVKPDKPDKPAKKENK